MSEDEKNPAREIISAYAQSHFRYFRTADGTVYSVGPVQPSGGDGEDATTHAGDLAEAAALLSAVRRYLTVRDVADGHQFTVIVTDLEMLKMPPEDRMMAVLRDLYLTEITRSMTYLNADDRVAVLSDATS